MAQLYNQFSDLQALTAEKDKIIALFKEVKDGIIELQKYGIKISSSSSIKEIDELSIATSSYKKELSGMEKQILSLTGKLATLTGVEAKQLESIKQVTKLTKEMTSADVKATLQRQAEFQSLQEQKIANQELAKSIQLRIKIRNSEAGSLEQMNLRYQKLSGIIIKFSEVQRNSARGQELIKQADQLKSKINEIQKSMGNFTANVGRYSESLAGGFAAVREEISKLEAKQQGLQDLTKRATISGFQISPDVTAELNNVTAQIEKLNQVNQIGFKTNQSYAVSVKQIEKAYQDMAASGGFSEEFLKEFKKFAAEAKDNAADLREEIKALSSDTRGLDLAVSGISVIASGFEAASGAAALLGADTEDVQRSIQKLVAIQSVANGVREVGEQITKRGTLANKAYNFVIQQGTILFGKGSTAAQRFGAALKGIVIVAAVGFIIQLIKSLSTFEDKAEDAQKALKKYNDELERNKKIAKDISGSDEFEFKSNIENIKRQNEEKLKLAKTETEKTKIEQDTKKKLFSEEVRFRKDQLDKLRVQQENANYDLVTAEFQKNTFIREAQKAGLKEISKDRIAAYDEQIKLAKENAENINEALKSGQRDLILFQKGQLVERAADEKEAAQKRLEDSKEAFEKEKTAALELFKYRQGLIKEQADFQSSDESILPVKMKIEAAQRASEAEIKILDAQREYDLDQDKIAASERILINERADNQIAESRFQLSKKILDIRIQALEREKQMADQGVEDFYQKQEEQLQAEIDFQQKGLEKQVKQIEKQHSEEQELNAKNFSNGLITKEQYDLRKEQIEQDYHRRILESQIIFYEKQLELLKASGKDTTDLEVEIAAARAALATGNADARAALATGNLDIAEQNKEREKQIIQETRDNYINAYMQIAEAYSNIIGGITERRKIELDEQIKNIDELEAAEVKRIEASADSEEKKAARIFIAEKKAEDQRNAIERRKRQIDRQKAIFERGFKSFEIITDTIVGVNKIKLLIAAAPDPITKALYTSQLILAIASGAGALTSLLAAPLPSYRFGTKSSVGGFARVAEDGPELAIEPSGKTRYFKRDSIVNLVQGTEILTADVTRNVINSAKQDQVHPAIAFVEKRTNDNKYAEETIHLLKDIKDRSGIHMEIQSGIEVSAWYIKNFKR